MGRMLAAVSLCALFGSGCGGDPAEAKEGDGTLTINLGGDNPRLGDELAGAVPAPKIGGEDAAAAGGPVEGGPEVPEAGSGSPGNDLRIAGGAMEFGAVESAGGFRTVTLGRGETLYSLAVHHLDDGNRWREILQLNGWREDQVGDLTEGIRVRLPAK